MEADKWDTFLEAYNDLHKRYENLDNLFGQFYSKISKWTDSDTTAPYLYEYYKLTGRTEEAAELKETFEWLE